ncbi:MAG TPA: hypothetical protein VGH56_12715, partial [Solirubrobacteraceae bacterium]
MSAHFLIPGNVPPDSASPARIVTFAREHRGVLHDLIGGPGNDPIGRSFLIAPAILLPLGFVILKTRLLPPQLRLDRDRLRRRQPEPCLLGLFSKVAFADVNPAVLALEKPLADHGRGDAARRPTLAR